MASPPLLYLHGLAGDLFTTPADQGWPAFLDALGAQFSITAPAHPGYDGGPSTEGLDAVEDYVFLYLDLLDELGHNGVELVGFSLGGWLAAELALRYPRRVR